MTKRREYMGFVQVAFGGAPTWLGGPSSPLPTKFLMLSIIPRASFISLVPQYERVKAQGFAHVEGHPDDLDVYKVTAHGAFH